MTAKDNQKAESDDITNNTSNFFVNIVENITSQTSPKFIQTSNSNTDVDNECHQKSHRNHFKG